MGNPIEVCTMSGFDVGDRANIVDPKYLAGEHTICDINGNSLKLSDVKDGMLVKIRAKNVHWAGRVYLYTSENNPSWGKYFAIQEIKIRQ